MIDFKKSSLKINSKIELAYPFIIIYSIFRSGSTLLQELLSNMPHSYIFHEPRFTLNIFNNRDSNLEGLKAHSELYYSLKELKEPFLTNAIDIFKQFSYIQFGVKEVKNLDWKAYSEYIGNIKFLLLGRDPRDIYISYYYYLLRNGFSLSHANPKLLFERLYKAFQKQVEIFDKIDDCVKIRYEDLCNDEKKIEEIKEFVESPIPENETGEIGFFHIIFSKKYELDLHNKKVTNQSTFRYKKEKNKEVLSDANKFFNLFNEYNDFWSYEL